MKSSLLEMMIAVADGSIAGIPRIEWDDAFAVTTVLAAAGYPDSPRAGDPIRLPAPPRGIRIFHAGTKRGSATEELLTAGGRVLAITGIGESLGEAACLLERIRRARELRREADAARYRMA
jgi:phosphoribosylamine--glycine ligase